MWISVVLVKNFDFCFGGRFAGRSIASLGRWIRGISCWSGKVMSIGNRYSVFPASRYEAAGYERITCCESGIVSGSWCQGGKTILMNSIGRKDWMPTVSSGGFVWCVTAVCVNCRPIDGTGMIRFRNRRLTDWRHKDKSPNDGHSGFFDWWGGRWGSNPRQQESQSWTLPTELLPPSAGWPLKPNSLQDLKLYGSSKDMTRFLFLQQ